MGTKHSTVLLLKKLKENFECNHKLHTLHEHAEWVRLVDWHQFVAQIVATRVQRNGEIHVQLVTDLCVCILHMRVRWAR